MRTPPIPGRADQAKSVAWFALVGLHLALDQGRTGREVQRRHMRLRRQERTWPTLAHPDDLACMSVAEVMRQPQGDAREDALLLSGPTRCGSAGS